MKQIITIIFIVISFALNSQSECNFVKLDSTLILKDSINKNVGEFYFSKDSNNIVVTDFEISLNISGGLTANSIYRIYCENGVLKGKYCQFKYSNNYLNDSLLDRYGFVIELDYVEDIKLDSINYNDLIDSLIVYRFFTLKNMESDSIREIIDIGNGEKKVKMARLVFGGCNSWKYNFEYKIGETTRSYIYNTPETFLKYFPKNQDLVNAIRIVNLFYNK